MTGKYLFSMQSHCDDKHIMLLNHVVTANLCDDVCIDGKVLAERCKRVVILAARCANAV